MRIGIIVDGESEFRSLKQLIPALNGVTGNTLIGPVLAKIPPLAPLPLIARVCGSRISVLEQRCVERVIVLFDRETRAECPGALATALGNKLSAGQPYEVNVVLKVSMLENWLLSDLGALRQQNRRFRVSSSLRSAVEPDKADHCKALDLLKRACIGSAYDKVMDSQRILQRADVERMSKHSRSFRRFLRVVDHPSYLTQSRLP
jgi:hypothetical protein